MSMVLQVMGLCDTAAVLWLNARRVNEEGGLAWWGLQKFKFFSRGKQTQIEH